MNISLQPHHTLAEARSSFRALYPLLSLRFFQPSAHGASDAEHWLRNDELTLKEAFGFAGSLQLPLLSTLTVSDLEKRLSEVGILAQVFRSNGKVWVETRETDHLTLGQQQSLAEEMHQSIPDVNPGDIDYD
jgi:hypothetical protein